jgi:cysteate synthase
MTSKGSDYFDAIHLGNIACEMEEKFYPEGGAKNIARREGMGTTMLSAAEFIGKIPKYYFQGVGSGTGAISAWEAALRLEEDGRFGENNLKLMVSQNLPFKILQDAWRADSRELLPIDDNLARNQVDEIIAKVLSNRKPPYPPAGGLYDALKDTDGDVLTASNKEAEEASKLFEKLEGNDIDPAAAVALATLIKASNDNVIDKNESVMLNITGGGAKRFQKENKIYSIKPKLVFEINADSRFIKENLINL